MFFFFKQKTAYEMRISDWSSDVCSSDLLAAVRHQQLTGEGQFIYIGMLDTSVGWLANQGMNYLATGENPPRLGNQHPNIVPYQVMPTADGHIVLSVGNDATFERFCDLAGCRQLLEDERFATNGARVRNRQFVTETLNEIMRAKPSAWRSEEHTSELQSLMRLSYAVFCLT